jgi:multiple sugar transport system permease protein
MSGTHTVIPKDRTRSRSPELGSNPRLFMSPAVILIVALTIFPFAFSLAMTFTNWNLAIGDASFIGFGNWQRLWNDETFRATARNTAFYVMVGTTIQYLLGLGLALSVLQIGKGQRFFRVLFLLPMMVSPVAVGFIIGRMVLSETQGPLAQLIGQLGLGHIGWISDPAIAPWTIVLTDTWQWTSFVFVFMLAGLQAIPDEPLEAASVDGGTPWQIFWHIKFPLLLPVTVTVVLIRALETFKLIDIVRVITAGGPGTSTETVTLFVFDLALRRGDVGYGATVGFALLIMAIIFSLLYLGLTWTSVRSGMGE